MGGMRPSGLHVNKPVVVGLIFTFVACFAIYKYVWGASTAMSFSKDESSVPKDVGSLDVDVKHASLSVDSLPNKGLPKESEKVAGKILNISQLMDPPKFDNAIKAAIERRSELVNITINEKKYPIHVEISVMKDKTLTQSILFLHGARFSSKDWIDINVLDNIASWGFKAVAVDLPGYGQSKEHLDVAFSNSLLPALISALQISKPVIVSPSMSGQYSLPFLFQDPEKSLEKATAFVPVAPVGVPTFSSAYPKSQIPTLIVYGTKDLSLGVQGVEYLKLLPNSFQAPVANAGHPCYIDDPKSFMKYLFAFLKQLSTKVEIQ